MAWKFWTTSRCQTSSNLNNTLACAMQLGEDYKHRSYHSFEKTGCLITADGSEDSKINSEGLNNCLFHRLSQLPLQSSHKRVQFQKNNQMKKKLHLKSNHFVWHIKKVKLTTCRKMMKEWTTKSKEFTNIR